MHGAPRMLASQAEVSMSKHRREDHQNCCSGGGAGQTHRDYVHSAVAWETGRQSPSSPRRHAHDRVSSLATD